MSISRNAKTATRNEEYERNEELQDSSGSKSITAQDAASYVNEIALELRTLARSAGLFFLAYLLELVIEESAVQKRGRL